MTSLNGLGRIRTNTDVSTCKSHLRFPFQSVENKGHSQGMSHLILVSTSKTGQTSWPKSTCASSLTIKCLNWLELKDRHQTDRNIRVNDKNSTLCDWSTVQGMIITLVIISHKALPALFTSWSRYLSPDDEPHICLAARLRNWRRKIVFRFLQQMLDTYWENASCTGKAGKPHIRF